MTATRSTTEMLEAALDLALAGWRIFPLAGKIPAIPKAAGGNGVLDATTDIAQINAWWAGRYRGCNVGARVPDALVVVDVDPRHDGLTSLAALEAANGLLPATLTVMSGRGDGGRHLYYRRPQGKLSATRLGTGIDIKTSAGYCVVPPSVHPDSGKPYTWVQRPVMAPPDWLIGLLLPPSPPPRRQKPRNRQNYWGPSLADQFAATTCWAEILQPHGWTPIDPDPDADGARWRHPAATTPVSATVRNGCLFVYSTNTPFDVTEPGNVHGYTRFRAWAVLNHGGDLSAAARDLRKESA